MRLPQRLARANRVVTNPLMRPLARRVAPMAVIHHRGRRSGEAYSSPVLAFGIPDGYVIPLTYGPDRDWVRNVQAAGQFEIERRGHTVAVDQPEVETDGGSIDLVGAPWSRLLRSLNLDAILVVRRAPADEAGSAS